VEKRVEEKSPRTAGKLIRIKGARVHNLKNVSLDLPRHKLIVVTGVSGSGKSSLAFDTIYAEGQRRYVESLSAYARQFLERMEKPDLDFVDGISPAVAIEQKTNIRNPRSTVGTTTEVYDYLRLLFGRIGKIYCHTCGRPVVRDTVPVILESLRNERDGTRFYILFRLRKEEHVRYADALTYLREEGFTRLYHDGEVRAIDEIDPKSLREDDPPLVLVDRLVWRGEESETRVADSIETAYNHGDASAIIHFVDDGRQLHFSQRFECSYCNIPYSEPEPRLFSFNNPFGACPTCQGFGRSMGIDMEKVVPNPEKTLREGAIHPWTFPKFRENLRSLMRVAAEAGIPVDIPFKDLSDEQVATLRKGYGSFDGLNGFFKKLEKKTYKIHYRVLLSRYRGYTRCQECNGARLRPEALMVRIGNRGEGSERTIGQIVSMSIAGAYDYFRSVNLTDFERGVAARLLDEITRRLAYLNEVGIGYLTLDRLSSTLSGGESQRINLATALGSSLVGSLYVLDEPSIGLHPRDNHKLIGILQRLRNAGNTVLVVEHDEAMIRSADYIVDMGPRAGEEGGEVVFAGPAERLLRETTSSLTAAYLLGKKTIPVPEPSKRRGHGSRDIVITGAREHNLKNLTVRIPLHRFVCVTGVSGSGKSTLVHNILYAGLRKLKSDSDGEVGAHTAIEGIELIDHVELVDQSPIGRTPRSNAVTYVKAFDVIRDLFASTHQARVRGYKPGHFSFNVPGGRCDECEGDGYVKIEMQFLPDIYLTCESCKGKRYKKEVLGIRWQGFSIDDVLNMTVREALVEFKKHKGTQKVVKKLQVLDDVGLGYLRLGQPATTLSGGEAQRVKLAAHLMEREKSEHTLFILDEPTTGLHFDDIAKLLGCFGQLIDAGHSVLVIEHNMDVIKCADYIIDLGPEGGDAGGSIVAEGTPEEIAGNVKSETGKILRDYLRKNRPETAGVS
jgi:excinuclease ABC subunit A